MKRIISLIPVLILSFGLSAEVLLVENFDYTIGTDLTANGWFCSYGGASGISVTNGLEYTGYAGSGVGGAAVIDVKSSSSQPHLAFRKQVSGNIYTAFLFQPTVNLKSGYFFCLRDSLLDGNTFNYSARVFIGQDYRLGLTLADNQKVVYSNRVLSCDSVYHLVLEYAIVPGENNDSVSLYLNGKPLITGLTDEAKTDVFPAHVALRGFDTNGWLVVDGIRVATSFSEAAALTPTTPEPQPQPEPDPEPTPDPEPEPQAVVNAEKNSSSPRKILCGDRLYILRDNTVFSLL